MATHSHNQNCGSTTQFEPTDYGMETGPSAVAIVDLVYQCMSPTSVVDVGCGTGVFLQKFQNRGVDSILGLDGPRTRTVFDADKSNFLAVDLTEPLNLGRHFDLALCLEVAEHLPESSAGLLVKTLTDLAPVVLFSAAHPGQGGHGHINECWPVYWQRRFSQHGFVALDIFRGPLSRNPRVLDCYRRNLVLYVESSLSTDILKTAEGLGVADAFILAHTAGVVTELEHQPWRVLIQTLILKFCRRIRRSVQRLVPTLDP